MSSGALSPSPRFAVTRWSMVLAAGDWRDGSAARQAMGELAQTYWFPLYAYLRRNGQTPAAAEDLVQGFFTRLLEKDALGAVDRGKGKFRSFLLASLKNYLANERDKAHAAKRGGGAVLSLEGLRAEDRYAAEPVDALTAERIFERRWALAVLEQVLGRLRAEYDARGQAQLFAALEHVLAGGKAQHADAAEKLGMTEGAAKVAAHRMRKRYRELLRAEIRETVASEAQVDEEIRHLLRAL